MWIQFIIGIVAIFFGVMVNVARQNSMLKAGIEKYILGGDDLFSTEKEYHRIVKWLGWPAIMLGVGIAIPSSFLWDIGIVCIIVFLVFRARREYEKFAADMETRKTKAAGV